MAIQGFCLSGDRTRCQGLSLPHLGTGREGILGDVVRGLPHGALIEDSGGQVSCRSPAFS